MAARPRPAAAPSPATSARLQEARAAAIALFAERGYRGTTINDIADRMGIRGPSLYKHVASKQELLRDAVTAGMEHLLADQAAAIAGADRPARQLHELVRVATLFHVERRAWAFVCSRELVDLEEPGLTEVRRQRDDYWRRLRGVLDAGVAEGAFTIPAPAVATFSIIELITGPAGWYDTTRSALGPAAVAVEVADEALRLVGGRRPARRAVSR